MPRPIALITGAGSGIGAAIAARLAGRYDLVLSHLEPGLELDAVAARAGRTGTAAALVTGDLTDATTMQELTGRIRDVQDRLEVVVSNAGAYPRITWNDTIRDFERFRHQIDLNLTAHAALAAAATPALTASGRGRYIATSSVLTQLGRTDLAGYIAAKAGLEGFVRALARELGPAGTTVNCVRAGSIEVRAEHNVVTDHAAMVQRQLARQAVKRRGTPDDIAAAVSFLASSEAGFITGQCLTVDGGWCLT
jgi:NAD(P)-dependent dehydrogenase (short-subunit alcohol dehydrogenase family)